MAFQIRRLLLLHPKTYLCQMKILMVCLGNICRSPLAEGILQEKAIAAGLRWVVHSAGTNGYHTGEPPHQLSQKVAELNGIDIRCQRSRDFKSGDFREYDMIYAMAVDVLRDMKKIAGNAYDPAKTDLLMNVLYPGKNLNVPDPWYGGEEGFHEVYRMISLACDGILKKQSSRHPASGLD